MSGNGRLVIAFASHSIAIAILAAGIGFSVAAELVALPLLLAGAIVVVGWALLRRVRANTNAMREFLAAATYADVGRRFTEADEGIDPDLAAAFDRVLDRLRGERRDSAAAAHRLDLLMRHIPVPLIVLSDDVAIRYANQAARRFFELSSLAALTDFHPVAPSLPALIQDIPAGQAQIVTLPVNERPADLRLRVSEMRIEGRIERIVTFENLTPALGEREANAWRDLTRVLSHEIMNTLTPVTSLAETSRELIRKRDRAEDVEIALETISRRSRGLMEFVGSYRAVSRPPAPRRTRFSLIELFEQITILNARDCSIETNVRPASLTLHADRALVEQTLINLVKNSGDAGAGFVRLSAFLERGRTVIEVADDGPGIDEEVAELMFVPFFTTKTDGSGIGLSVARQIMAAHGGSISYVKLITDGARFVLVF